MQTTANPLPDGSRQNRLVGLQVFATHPRNHVANSGGRRRGYEELIAMPGPLIRFWRRPCWTVVGNVFQPNHMNVPASRLDRR